MSEFLFWLLGVIAGAVWTIGILADHSSPNLVGKDRADLLLMKAECEKTLTRQESCKAVITFVPE